VEQRIVEAGAVLPAFGGVTGWAALRWRGAQWFTGLHADRRTTVPVTLATSCQDIRPQQGIDVSAEHLCPADIELVDGLRVTTAVRSVLFEMRHAVSVEAAVVYADMAMYVDLVSIDELWAYAATLATWTGIPQARAGLGLARENSWSPQETRLRTVWVVLAGLPEPLCNVPVFDLTGRHIGTPDLLDPVTGVVGEYEGGVHLDRRRRGIDVRREQAFREVGLEYFPVVATDWRDERRLLERMHAAYARARDVSHARRKWTLEPPAWWIRTDTVARRRQLTEHDRLTLLSRRVA
jgi:hypothetical protein